METIKFNRDSWHVWLANFGRNKRFSWDRNICDYTKAVLLGTLKLILAIVGVSIGGFVLVSMVLFVAYGLYGWGVFIYTWATMGMILVISPSSYVVGIILMAVTIIGSLAGISLLFLKVKDILAGTICSSKPSFLCEAYRSFKDRICFSIEFINEKEKK